MHTKQKIVSVLRWTVPTLLIPAVLLLGVLLFQDRQYLWISLCVAVLSCVPVFLSFERKRYDTVRLVLLAVWIALTALGRVIFAVTPGFKPVTAMVVLCALYFGPQAGFVTGALGALLSNLYFGQGPWTPFQMFVWGMIGLLAGALEKPLRRSRVLLSLYGVVSGVLYSFLMDVWTVLWWDGHFNLLRYQAALISALPFTVTYAVSNVVFLLLLVKPVGRIFRRMQTKYGI